MDMRVNSQRLSSAMPMPESPDPQALDDTRIRQLMRWHGTDETNLPPAATLQNLSRDTLAALQELREARAALAELQASPGSGPAEAADSSATVADLRAALGRAFWATEFREVHAILLDALGPPPEDDPET
ncbi:MAG: hypothetical protein ABI885_01475 [Gammaproteobacteria bacterium]